MLKRFIVARYTIRNYCSNPMLNAREKLRKIGKGNVSIDLNDTTGIASITIDQENRRNALSGKMMVDFETAVNEVEKWPDGKAVLLQGKGDFFCSGGDLTTVSNICNPADGALMCAYMQDVTSRLANLPLVSFALVHGGALGGGAELATCTDFRIFTDTAIVAFVQANMGVSTGWGGGTRLTRLVGPSLALKLLLSCKKIDHEEAMKIGLADFVVGADNRARNAVDLISSLIKHDGEVVCGAKNVVLNATKSIDVTESLAREREIFSTLWGGPANLKILKAGVKHR